MITKKSIFSETLSDKYSIPIFLVGLWGMILFRKMLIHFHLPMSLTTIMFWVALLLVPFVKRPVVWGLITSKTIFSLVSILNSNRPASINGIVANIVNLLAAFIFAELLYRIIDSLRNMNKQLITETEKAQEATKAKALFLANMSHEIRTPISGIRGLTDMLLTENKTNTQDTEYLKLIKSSTDTLTHIVNNVLNFSRIEIGKEEVTQSVVPIRKVIMRLVDSIKTTMVNKSVTLNLIIDDTVPTHVLSDEIKINQILSNLTSNAIKFTDSGEITVNISYAITDKERITIAVTDSGIGIEEDKQDLIFSEFERVQTSYEKSREGTGLGLAITKGIVEKLKGTITVTSEYQKGSTFTVQLPVLEVSAPETTSNTSQKDNCDEAVDMPGVHSILLAEDNKVNQIYIKHFLEKQGYDLTIVENGEQAINSFKTEHYNLVLMDIQMPIKSGLQATKEIREFEKQHDIAKTPILALTASVTEEEQRLFLSSGMDQICPKPIDMAHLLCSLKSHIN